MPAPATVDEFLDLVRKSGVADEAKLTAYIAQLQAGPSKTSEPKNLAGHLVKDGILTYFQAEQFLQGKWRRFTIGKYKVLERLGSGGMGTVYLCEHKLMRRRVALKVLPNAKAEDPSSLDRFYREARAVAALDHPNIVRAYDIDQEENLHFLVMEYVEGASLQDMVKKFNKDGLDFTRACHYIRSAAIGLEHAHEAGLIHRDIKPGNILVDKQGIVKILDLGLARFFNDDDDLLTKKYDESVLGTADYLAPEQAVNSHEVDGRADIYSLGATFYFLLSGNPPFVEGTITQKLLWHQSRPPKPIQGYRPDIPDGIVAIVEKMMAKEPGQRYQTPADVADALTPWVATPIGPPPEKEMPQLCAAVVAAGGAGGNVTSRSLTMSCTVPNLPPPLPPPSRRTAPSSKKIVAKKSTKGVPAPGNGPRQQPAPPAPVNEVDTTRRRGPAPVADSSPTMQTATEPNPVWESITAAAETSPTTPSDTDPPSSPSSKTPLSRRNVSRPPSSRIRGRSQSAIMKSRRRLYLYAGLSVAGLVGLIILVWLVAFRGGGSKEPAPKRLVVSASGQTGPGLFRTVKQAVESAKPGDRIAIQDELVEEALNISNPPAGLVIEPAEGKHVVWRLPPTRAMAPPISVLEISGAEGFQLRGIAFEAQDKVKSVIRVTGRCPGLVLDGLTLSEASGPKSSAVLFVNCVGEDNRPVVMKNCRILKASHGFCQVGVGFFASADSKAGNRVANVNHAIRVQDCRLEGPFQTAAFQIEGAATGIEIRSNRILNAVSGLFIRSSSLGADQPLRVTLTGNTFKEIHGSPQSATLRFETAKGLVANTHALEVTRNLFFNCGVLLATDDKTPIPSGILIAKDNGSAGDSAEAPGSIQIATPAGIQSLPDDPANDKTFLRAARFGVAPE